jgi:hypothetical protein
MRIGIRRSRNQHPLGASVRNVTNQIRIHDISWLERSFEHSWTAASAVSEIVFMLHVNDRLSINIGNASTASGGRTWPLSVAAGLVSLLVVIVLGHLLHLAREPFQQYNVRLWLS